MHEFKEGDRVRYTGPSQPGSGEPALEIPDLMTGEVGWVIDVYQGGQVCVVSWDRHGTIDMGSTNDLEWLGRNEADPLRRVPEEES